MVDRKGDGHERRNEATSLDSFAIYETIVRSMAEAVYVRDLRRGLVYINPAAERLTGWSLKEALALPCYQVFGDVDAGCNLLCPVDRSIAAQGEIRHLEGQVVTRSGSIVDCGVSISPIIEDVAVVGSVVVLEDRSALREMEKTNLKQLLRLQESERELAEAKGRFQDFAESSSDWFWETDAEDRMVSIVGRDDVDLAQFLGRLVPDEVGALHLGDAERAEVDAASEARRPFRDLRVSLRRQDGAVLWASISGRPRFAEDGAFLGYRGVARDITRQVELEDAIRRRADYDDLTGLPNRRWFDEAFATQLAQATRHGEVVALLFIDLDGFKAVNDRLGHGAGDTLLRRVGERLRRSLRAGDVVARIGGDEFAVLLPRLRDVAAAEAIAEKVLASMREPFALPEGEARIGASIGLALHPDHGTGATELMRRADVAMYEAKRAGKDRQTMAGAPEVGSLVS